MLKYEQIALQINAYIAEGNYQAGDKLPSVETLKAQYEVSKSTIIKALEALEKKGESTKRVAVVFMFVIQKRWLFKFIFIKWI